MIFVMCPKCRRPEMIDLKGFHLRGILICKHGNVGYPVDYSCQFLSSEEYVKIKAESPEQQKGEAP